MINILAGLSWCCAAPMSKYPVVNPSGNTPGIPAARASAPWLGRLFSAKLPLAALTKKVPVVLAMKLKFLTIPEVEPELLLYAPQFNMVVPAPLTSRKPNAEFASAKQLAYGLRRRPRIYMEAISSVGICNTVCCTEGELSPSVLAPELDCNAEVIII